MPRTTPRTPAYRRHKPSGQAVVTLNGRDHYLGPYGTKTSHNEYDRLIAEWLAGGRRLGGQGTCDLAVVELINDYRKHAETYYRRPDGSPGDEVKSIRLAMLALRRLYGRTPAAEFGPRALKAVREAMIRDGWCRGYVNQQVGRVKRMFKWAVENEVVPPSLYHALEAVAGLKKDRTPARETDRVLPVPQEHVDAVVAHVSPQVAAMIRLQLLTGMRPGEVCAMRSSDVDTTGRLWLYCPAHHKTQHHGHVRVVFLGPQAQVVLGPFLKPDLRAYIFSPAEAEARRRADLSRTRTTPMSCGNRPGSNRKRRPKRRPTDCYDVATYRRAIARACDRAFPPPADLTNGMPEDKAKRKLASWRAEHRWNPNQLRHNAGTNLRRDYGLEAAQVILGHKTLSVTQIYAEKNVEAAKRIMAEVG